MHQYRVGVIGCGRISAAHANGYRAIERTQIVAAAEPNPERRVKFGETYGVTRLYEDYPQMLEDEELDIVSICTWPKMHCPMTIAAAERGVKGILCEKPMAFNLKEADKMIEACEKSGTKLAIGHQHRFDAQSVKALQLVKDGAIGELMWIFGHCGSDLLSNGTHVIDLIKFFVDDSPVVWVMGQIDRHGDLVRFGHPAEDMAIGHFQFENGVRAFIEQGELAPSSYAFHLYGAEGMIGVNAPQGKQLSVITTKGAQEVVLPKSVNSHQAEIEELLAWIEGAPEHRSNSRHGRETMEIIMAIMESSRLRRKISLPLKTKESPLELMIREKEA